MHTRTRRLRTDALISRAAILALALTACTSDDTSDQSATTTTKPTTSVATTAEPTASAPHPATSAPPATTKATTSSTTTEVPGTTPQTSTTVAGAPDWVAIITALSTTLNEIQAAPDVSRVTEYCIIDTACYATHSAAIQQLVDNGWRTVDRPVYPVLSAELASTVDDQPVETSPFVVIRATVEITDPGEARIVDSAGDLVYRLTPEEEPGTQGVSLWTLARADTGEWRVIDVENLP